MPLTQTTWDQSPFVNALCPSGSVTGCVATAMAQIMKYWNFPPNGTGSHSYNEQTYGTQYVDFAATTYNWPAMVTAVAGPCPDIATLMYSCGVSVDMSYSPSGSGAYVISAQSPVINCAEYAFKTYFGYDPNTVLGIEYGNYTYQAFITILKNELDNSRPMQYAGYGQGGHTWVCDGYDVNDFFHMNWGWGGMYNSFFDLNALNPGSSTFNSNQQVIIGIQPEAFAPVADFSANYTATSCSGIVQFTDLSSHFPTSWLWDFGDGTTDTVRSPSHSYATSGTYTIKLIESNNQGTDSIIKTNYVSVNITPRPVASNVIICNSGATTLSATGTGTLRWYNSYSNGSVLNTGSVFTTPLLTTTTTYYVESALSTPPVYGGKPNNSGGGGYNTNASNYLIFDCYTTLTLISVDVYANSTGQRTIQLRDNAGTVIQSANVNITATGLNTVNLNFSVPVGTNLQLGLATSSVADLYRNNAGITYPYATTGLLSITNSSAGNSRYYYFYNWQITSSSCTSARTPVTVQVVRNALAGFSFNAVSRVVNFHNISLNSTGYLWNFGDGDTTTQSDPVHTYASDGSYNVSLTASNYCGQDVLTQSVDVIATGIESMNKESFFEVYPNPGNGVFNVKFLSADSKDILVNIFDIRGKMIYSDKISSLKKGDIISLDLSNFEKGIYHLELVTKSEVKNKIIILQ
jgi:PKD repeat protein